MSKKTTIIREYSNGELIKETETVEEYEPIKFVPTAPQTPTYPWRRTEWWQQPWSVTVTMD